MKPRCIAFLGESKVGKTALICRVYGDFFPCIHHPTEEEVYSLNLFLSDEAQSVQLIDTSGDRCRQYQTVCQLGEAYVVVFSVKDKESFETASCLVRSLSEDCCGPVLLVGNQADENGCRRQVDTAEATRLAGDYYGVIEYIETSALDEVNTADLRERLAALLCCAQQQTSYDREVRCVENLAVTPVVRSHVHVDRLPVSHENASHLSVVEKPRRKSSSSQPFASLSRRFSLRSTTKPASSPPCATRSETQNCERRPKSPSSESSGVATSTSLPRVHVAGRTPSPRPQRSSWCQRTNELDEDLTTERRWSANFGDGLEGANDPSQASRSGRVSPRLRNFANLMAKVGHGLQVPTVRFPKFKRIRGLSAEDMEAKREMSERDEKQTKLDSAARRILRTRSFKVDRAGGNFFRPSSDSPIMSRSQTVRHREGH